MQNELNISSSEFSPEVDFNAGSGILSISGRSMPEDVGSFFEPIIEWIDEYIENARDQTIFKVYF